MSYRFAGVLKAVQKAGLPVKLVLSPMREYPERDPAFEVAGYITGWKRQRVGKGILGSSVDMMEFDGVSATGSAPRVIAPSDVIECLVRAKHDVVPPRPINSVLDF